MTLVFNNSTIQQYICVPTVIQYQNIIFYAFTSL